MRGFSGHRGRGGGRGNANGRGNRGRVSCRFFQQGHCRKGASCTFSHDQSATPAETSAIGQRHIHTAAEQSYRSWRNILKAPPFGDLSTMLQLWSGALEILDNGEKDWQQKVPRDLVEEVGMYGYQYVQEVMTTTANSSGESRARLIHLVTPFLQVVSHPALLNCLSVDMYVGDLYSFISGSGGNRAVPFLLSLADSLAATTANESTPDLLVAMTTALREILKRTPKAQLHEDIESLLEKLDGLHHSKISKDNSVEFQTVKMRIAELQRIIRRAHGTFAAHKTDIFDGVQQLQLDQVVVTSTFPRDIQLPSSRHDNDHLDIAAIEILPTEAEVLSDLPEFLPSTDLSQPHFLEGVERHLDTHFRLFRHEAFSEVKSTLSGLLNIMRKSDTELGQIPSTLSSNTNAYVYTNTSINYINFTRRQGLEVHISFLQPHHLDKKSQAERRKWWEGGKRFEDGTLLCLLSSRDDINSMIFLTVNQKDTKGRYCLVSEGRFPTVTANLAPGGKLSQLQSVIKLNLLQSENNILVEFPGVLLGAFAPILENLQQMQKLGQLPFEKWIIDHAVDGPPEVPPPLYARGGNFVFDLKAILTEPKGVLRLSPATTDDEMITRIERMTALDRGQCEALVAALTREFALIQGPPGTGKSYVGVQIMRVLLANKFKARLGPIVVVCYTNHALDQFLEHLMKVGVRGIIRIGGNSSSTLLEGNNLRVVSKSQEKFGGERSTLAEAFSDQDMEEQILEDRLHALRGIQKVSWSSLRDYMCREFPLIFRQFSSTSSDGFTHASKWEPFDLWKTGRGENPDGLSKVPVIGSLNKILWTANNNVYQLSLPDRKILMNHFVQKISGVVIAQILYSIREFENLQHKITNIHDEVDRRVLAMADVIGVTTSGLAKRISVLRHIDAKVVMCEEAGEVLEAHMLSALIPSVQHLIQIGDHQQLRPTIKNFDLSLESSQGRQYQLDRSQFERLAVVSPRRPGFPIAPLNIQRRMRPEISRLIRNTLYPRLVDHSSTKNFPDGVGLRKNVFWLHHTKHEDNVREDHARQKSKSNMSEVDLTHALVRHIVRQGVYNSNDIAVLTPYGGQLQKLRFAMRNDFEIVLSERDEEALAKDGLGLEAPEDWSADGPVLQKKAMSELLRIVTADNFQGEEAKVIIISLVRSNDERKVGFLKTTNRINVLLSRAQHGMYLIGNADTYANVPMWSNVIGMLRASDSIGEALGLRCPRHPETDISVSTPDDFTILSPEGGCRESCDRRLPSCGHRCLTKCHSDMMHEAFMCPQPCERLFQPCGHDCPKDCGDKCGLCQIEVKDVKLACGHIKDKLYCFQTQNLTMIRCSEAVNKLVESCGHTVTVTCYQDTTSEWFRCPVPCNFDLPCSHRCSGTCGSCIVRIGDDAPRLQHQKCAKACGRRLGTCNHICQRRCHIDEECGLCYAPCEVRCAHSRCDKTCHEACTPCIQSCAWSCEHQGNCSLPCAAPCDRLPCGRRCPKELSCGHQCPSLCGETCPPPDFCRVCSDKQDHRVDILEFKDYRDINLDSTPIVVLNCGHFFTAETLDGLVGMHEVYEADSQGDFSALRDISSMLSQSIPRCPDCQRPIRQYATQRYNRTINRAVMDEISKRFILSGKTKLRGFEKEADVLESDVEKSKAAISVVNAAGGHLTPRQNLEVMTEVETRTENARRLINYIQKFLMCVSDEQQPVRKVHDATLRAIRATQPLERQMERLSVNGISAASSDRQVIFSGRSLLLRVQFIALTDNWETNDALKALHNAVEVKESDSLKRAKEFFETSDKLINDCRVENFPKLNVVARIYYGRAALLCRVRFADKAYKYVNDAKELLEGAEELCANRFQNADTLLETAKEMLRMLGKERYEPVTAEELAAIKKAMVSGSGGIATHSGHWYNCQNGHPFAIGECGMPMERARCPECGAPVGGERHEAVAGVTRAIEMED